MSTVNLQNAPITLGSPIEIEAAIEVIRSYLATMDWMDQPYFIAQRFTRQKGSMKYIYPETYARNTETPSEKYPYFRLTPDGDFQGRVFFYPYRTRYNDDEYIISNVAVIFSANLSLIDQAKLELGLFTQELIKESRQLIRESEYLGDFTVQMLTETRDLREVFREFVLEDLEQYNRAPMQSWRIDIELTVLEDCP